jgi:hypothetical protein
MKCGEAEADRKYLKWSVENSLKSRRLGESAVLEPLLKRL